MRESACRLVPQGYDTMSKFFHDFIRDESGASAAEYALILAVVGAGIAAAAFALGGAISTSIDGAKTKVAECGAANITGCTS